MTLSIFTGKRAETEENRMFYELWELRREISNERHNLDFACDSDLVEASIYKINSLNSRYRYLLNLARERNYKFESIIPVSC